MHDEKKILQHWKPIMFTRVATKHSYSIMMFTVRQTTIRTMKMKRSNFTIQIRNFTKSRRLLSIFSRTKHV